MLHTMTCTSSDLDKKKQLQSFKKDPGKIAVGVAFTRYPVPICFGRPEYVQIAEDVTKFNLRITAKCHAHLQALTKTPANVQ